MSCVTLGEFREATKHLHDSFPLRVGAHVHAPDAHFHVHEVAEIDMVECDGVQLNVRIVVETAKRLDPVRPPETLEDLLGDW